MTNKIAFAAGVTLAICAVAGCSQERPGAPQATTAVAPLANAKFGNPATAGAQPGAVTYDAKVVPVGAEASVTASVTGGKTTISLDVHSLPPNHAFGAHVHTTACGPKPADSGPHYQNQKDPVSPSVDPAFANAQNEVWLDLVTDDSGDASASASADWTFRPHQANAVVIHASHTHTEPGKAGTAGDRLACIDATF
ncbi:superoxide dismutase family protein [Amycolatopsis sp. NPDC051061]|uniref:superoxide dismutase family protein n=1 Tax=Amycolatopsis sp. NPDC051061 TaxID=3155042 RepID=UPI003417F8CE